MQTRDERAEALRALKDAEDRRAPLRPAIPMGTWFRIMEDHFAGCQRPECLMCAEWVKRVAIARSRRLRMWVATGLVAFAWAWVTGAVIAVVLHTK